MPMTMAQRQKVAALRKAADRHHNEHDMYMAHSPSYVALFRTFGYMMPIERAEQFAREHYTTVPALDLAEEDFKTEFSGARVEVRISSLLGALGY